MFVTGYMIAFEYGSTFVFSTGWVFVSESGLAIESDFDFPSASAIGYEKESASG